MGRAYRLIAVWMAGALASLAVYRWHALHAGEMGLAPVPARSAATGGDDPRDAVVRYLTVRYDDFELGEHGQTVLAPAYLPAEEPLIEIQDDVLRRFLPETRFFITRLVLPHTGLGLPGPLGRIEIVVSFRRLAGRDDIRSSLSVGLDKPSRKFLSQFIGAPAPTPEAQRALGRKITELLEGMSYECTARPCPGGLPKAPDGVVGDARRFDIAVAGDGRVKAIERTSASGHIDDIVTGF